MARIDYRLDTIETLKRDPRVWLTPVDIFEEHKKVYAKRQNLEAPMLGRQSFLGHFLRGWLFSRPPNKMKICFVLADLVAQELVAERLRQCAVGDEPAIYEYALTTLGRCRGLRDRRRHGIGIAPVPATTKVEPS